MINVNRLLYPLDRLARHRVLTIMMMAVLSFGGSWLWALHRGIPKPYCVDEFSYLLAGDTFAHGRITNPMHPMRRHLRVFNILLQPTYMSKYPPAQGVFLAIGEKFFGHPVWGVWLSAGLMSAAICWMLYAWLPPRWALVGGLVTVLQFGIFTYWSQSYWGGAVAAMGGGLVFGALPRIFRYQRLRDVLWLGLGCAVLFNSRPFEGFLVAMPVACLVLPWKIKGIRLDRRFASRVLLPLAFILLLIIIGVGAYNKQITGVAKIPPYFLYDHTYRDVPLFLWQRYVAHPHLFEQLPFMLKDTKRDEYYYDSKKTWKGFGQDMRNDSYWMASFFFGFLLAIPGVILGIILFFKQKTSLRFCVALLIFLAALAILTFNAKAHYFAPLTALVILLITIGLRWGALARIGRIRLGVVPVVLGLAVQLAVNLVYTTYIPRVLALARITQPSHTGLTSVFTRQQLENTLKRAGGKYLVLVSYYPLHDTRFDWVYNASDIDHAPVVWAWDMGPQANQGLLAYFKDRHVLFIRVFWDTHRFPHFWKRYDYDFRLKSQDQWERLDLVRF